MRSDIDFNAAKPVSGLITDACRGGVLYNLLQPSGPDEKLIQLYNRLITILRGRLSFLSTAGWTGCQAKDFRSLCFLRNCHPFGLRMGGSYRPVYCNRFRTCPWCYARKRLLPAIRTTDMAVRSLLGVIDPAMAADIRLSCMLRERRYHGTGDILDVLDDESTILRSDWLRSSVNPGVFGCLARSFVVPCRVSGYRENAVYSGYVIRVATVLLHTNTTVLPDDAVHDDCDCKTLTIPDTTNLSIARLLVRHMPFPAATLYSPESLIAPILNAYGKTRHTTFSAGLFNNNELCRATDVIGGRQTEEDQEEDLPVEEEAT